MKTFQRGRSTFVCAICKHRTRQTGVQGADSDLCPDCWELSGYENEQSDNDGLLAGSAPTVLAYIEAIEKKGGDASGWRRIFAGLKTSAVISLPDTDATGTPMVDASSSTTLPDEHKVLSLLMSRSIEEMERADIRCLTGLGEEACYRILRKLVAEGLITQRIHTGRRQDGSPVRVARYKAV